ncbi:MAG: threonine synthase, partial [Hymenobacter sp.]
MTGPGPDGGLYFPETIPRFGPISCAAPPTLDRADLALAVMRPYVGSTIPDAELHEICAAAVDFPFPLVPVSPGIAALELFHGPTLAFKDVGARFMSSNA